MTYSILTGINADTKEREMIFGDYNREVVKQERRDLQDSGDQGGYSKLWVDTLPNGEPSTIRTKLHILNENECDPNLKNQRANDRKVAAIFGPDTR